MEWPAPRQRLYRIHRSVCSQTLELVLRMHSLQPCQPSYECLKLCLGSEAHS